MKKIVEAIKIGESVGKKVLGRATEEDNRAIAGWEGAEEKKDELFQKISNPDFIQEKALFYKNFDVTKAWKEAKVREQASTGRRVGRRRFVWSAAAAIAVIFLSVTMYWMLRDVRGDEEKDVHQTIAKIVPGRGVPVLYLEDNTSIELNARVQFIEEKEGIEVGVKTLIYSKQQAKVQEKYNKLVVPKGAEYHLVLADGSEIWLNSESTLRYFVNDVDAERVVYLQGEAYFKIAKNEKRPFKVISGDHVVKVLGTEFNINAYVGESLVYTTLLEGCVDVGVVNHPDIHQVLSERGRQSAYNPTNKGISIRRVDPRVYTAWKEGYFVFNYSTLREVIHQLSRWYDFDYEADNSILDHYHFSGEFKRFDNLDRVLEVIRSTGIPFSLDYRDGKIIIRRNNV